jgi:hypothetical protein
MTLVQREATSRHGWNGSHQPPGHSWRLMFFANVKGVFMDSLNVLIAERIFGWEPVDSPTRRYRIPKSQQPFGAIQGGFSMQCPDFLQSPYQEMLREEMLGRGFSLNITHYPANFERDEGRMFTASYCSGERVFESTQPEENAATGVAALLAVGVQR